MRVDICGQRRTRLIVPREIAARAIDELCGSYERAQVLQWLFFEQYSHEPNIAVVRF